MLRRIVIVAAVLSLAAACGDKEDKAGKSDKTAKKTAKPTQDQAKQPPTPPPAAKLEMVETDLEPAGVKATIQAPKGAEVKESFGVAEVSLPDNSFHVEVGSGKSDLAKRKAEIAANDINKLKGYVAEEETAVLYESEVMGKSEFHVLVNVEGGEEGWGCEDSKGPMYTKAQAQAMFDACKSIKAK